MTKTPIDTVAMTRRIRNAHAERLKGKSSAERIAFYRKKARTLHIQRESKKSEQARMEERSE